MPDDGFRRERVEGGIRRMAPAGGRYGKVAMEMALSHVAHVRPRGPGIVLAAETGYRLAADPDRVRAPWSFIGSDRPGPWVRRKATCRAPPTGRWR